MSQLALAMEADISSKHVSFLETGKAQPSREMVLHLARVLDIPLVDRNLLLTQSGFAEAYSRHALSDESLQPVRQALELILKAHNPYPAIVIDWEWNILMVNESQAALGNMIRAAMPDFIESQNLADLLLAPNGYRSFIRNFDQVSSQLLIRLQKEASLYQDRFSNLLTRVQNEYGVRNVNSGDGFMNTVPMIPVELDLGGQKLSLFSTLATFGTPIDITVQELTIEQYFPADDETRLFFESLLDE